MTHLERIKSVYPFLYTLGYRANRGWLSPDIARERGAFLVTYPEALAVILLAGRIGVFDFGDTTAGLICLLAGSVAVSELIHHLNRRQLIVHRSGVRFAAHFDRIPLADKLWMGFYSSIFIALCLTPMIGLA